MQLAGFRHRWQTTLITTTERWGDGARYYGKLDPRFGDDDVRRISRSVETAVATCGGSSDIQAESGPNLLYITT